jgi:phosphotransferase system  glucose/maltose/N-acetylglucosamine-specific IIC component
MLGLLVFHAIQDNDWSQLIGTERLWQIIAGVGMFIVAYIVACFWGSLFAAVIYSIQYAFASRKSKANNGLNITSE